MKKEYASRNWNVESLKEIDIQQVGGYVSIHDSGLTEKGKLELSQNDESEYSSISYTDSQNSEYVEDDYQVDYNSYEWFEDEWKEFVLDLMNCKYNKYLCVAFNSTWTGASGYNIFDNYEDCFRRSYDCSQYYDKSSVKGKVLQLREYHHDCPMGHKTLIIGLTEQEFEKLDNMGINEIINWAKERELN